MREKLLDLMKSEGLKSSQLADMLGINPAGISHILAGRNKPGFDLLQKILRRVPRINPDWLILDSGPMYRDAEQRPSNSDLGAAPIQPSIVENNNSEPLKTVGDLFAHADAPQAARTLSSDPIPARPESEKSGNRTAAVERVVIFYDDRTFESYAPTKR